MYVSDMVKFDMFILFAFKWTCFIIYLLKEVIIEFIIYVCDLYLFLKDYLIFSDLYCSLLKVMSIFRANVQKLISKK